MIILAVAPVVCGLLIGYARGGRLRHLTETRVRAVLILWVIAALQLIYLAQPQLRAAMTALPAFPLLVPIFGLAGLWIILNLPHRPRPIQSALILILAGGAMNAIAIALNGKMPYAPATTPTPSPKHTPITPDTKAPWLADIIQFHPLNAAISLGDLALFLGITLLVAFAMRPHSTHPTQQVNSQTTPAPSNR
jgi:hypothetical protein